jgi:hypothetical protein
VRVATLLLLLALGCGVYGDPVRPAPAAEAPAGASCDPGETCEKEESR